MKVSRKIEGCLEEVLKVFQGNFKGLQRSFNVLSRKFQGCFMKISGRRKFQGCFMIFKGVPLVFQRCFKEVSRKLSRCFEKVSSCMALIAASRAEGGLVG